MSSKPALNQKIDTTIQRLGIHGEGIGYVDGYTVFIDGALPGETVQTQLVQMKKSYGKGRLVDIKDPSPSRITPRCPLFGKCGGCQLMHLNYDAQLEMKRQRVIDALERIGKFADVPVEPCLPSPSPFSYRNKIQLPVKSGPDGVRLGLFSRNSHDLVEVEHCHIHCDLGEKVFKEIREILQSSKITAYDWKTHKGELRYVIVKTAVNTEQVLVILVINGSETKQLQDIAEKIMGRCSEVKGVVQNINTKSNNVVLSKKFSLLAGQPYIKENIYGMTFKVSPASFFQVNPSQAERLYAKVVEYTDLTSKEIVLDAFCGVGTLTLLMSKNAKHVIGTECVPQAIEDAEENAKLNGVTNVEFVCEETESWIKGASALDVVVLNPPRKGCDPSILKEIGRILPSRVVYISCDPATLARDLAELKGFNYSIEAVQPLDMFPQTAHVETVVKLVHKGVVA